MVLSQMLGVVRSKGRDVTPSQVFYARLTGRLGNVPIDGVGNYRFDDGHVERMLRYLDSPRKRGRKPSVLANRKIQK